MQMHSLAMSMGMGLRLETKCEKRKTLFASMWIFTETQVCFVSLTFTKCFLDTLLLTAFVTLSPIAAVIHSNGTRCWICWSTLCCVESPLPHPQRLHERPAESGARGLKGFHHMWCREIDSLYQTQFILFFRNGINVYRGIQPQTVTEHKGFFHGTQKSYPL